MPLPGPMLPAQTTGARMEKHWRLSVVTRGVPPFATQEFWGQGAYLWLGCSTLLHPLCWSSVCDPLSEAVTECWGRHVRIGSDWLLLIMRFVVRPEKALWLNPCIPLFGCEMRSLMRSQVIQNGRLMSHLMVFLSVSSITQPS